MRTIALVLLAAIAFACSTSSTTPRAPKTYEESFRRLHDAYVVEFLRRNPSVNTYLGGAGLDPSLREADARLRDHSQAALDVEDRWLAATEKAMLSIDPATLSANSRIDRDVAIAQIRYQLHLHQVRHYQQRSVDTYTDEPFRAIDFQLQGMTQTGAATYGTEDEWTLVAQRLEAIPQYLRTAAEQI